MPRDWQAAVDQLSNVQKLVHLCMRMTVDDTERIRAELLRVRRRAYEDQLSAEAARVGCPGRRGVLGNGPSLSELNAMSQADAQSITNTYNADLSAAITNVAATTPRANRNTYVARLREWDATRQTWKQAQIAQYSDATARSLAQADFYRYNQGIMGLAVMEPKDAVCPVCQGWIARGETPLQVALNNPPPYHINCVHFWRSIPDKVARDQCPLLWLGQ